MRWARKCVASLPICAVVLMAAAPAMAAGAIVGAPIRSDYIYKHGFPSQDAAANAAMTRCLEKYGPGCHVIKVYDSGCLAIAQSSDGSHRSGWAVKSSEKEANLVAIGQCAKTGNSCHLDVSVCE
jgi:Domain of unknown function (DUF4189)